MPDLSLEIQLGGIVCGIDEVGRGPLCGPVVAAAVILDPARLPRRLLERLDDSKALSKRLREELADLVPQTAVVGFGECSVAEIDRLNILKATLLAMRRAYDAMGRAADHALVDGNRPPDLPCPVRCVVKGDSLSLSIAAASVVAKVRRDAMMAELALAYPGYGWERNAGYGTAEHLDALKRLGPTPHHRRSFAPVAQYMPL
ncbi:ribonuclease HII [Paramagnetospirillum kuznetsovii]|uniref:Ribonuclease HII n=1 Tax=Paramagnetospirillum kuznetsovii TaxID=2053833 RepID=A0A364P1T7_9PROT|nr:ribonuclease HII [Paramagnetospirillum kuznetsovii]RAU23127.1 ribonuclease HII [Paramagnetospirillum kuznetsovii]